MSAKNHRLKLGLLCGVVLLLLLVILLNVLLTRKEEDNTPSGADSKSNLPALSAPQGGYVDPEAERILAGYEMLDGSPVDFTLRQVGDNQIWEGTDPNGYAIMLVLNSQEATYQYVRDQEMISYGTYAGTHFLYNMDVFLFTDTRSELSFYLMGDLNLGTGTLMLNIPSQWLVSGDGHA